MKGGRYIYRKMAKLLLKTEIKRESGMLYFCGTSKDGFVTLNSAEMNRGGRKKSSTKKKAKAAAKTVTKKKTVKKTVVKKAKK